MTVAGHDRLDETRFLRNAERVAVQAAQSAGKLLRDCALEAFTARPKDSNGDVVSSLDIEAERTIVEQLHFAFPDHQVIAEEGGVSGAADKTWTWFVDPLDGTNNLAIGLPAFVVGLALCRRQRPVVGVVHEPLSHRTWSAVRGHGIRVHTSNGPRLVNRPADRLGAPVLAWTQGHAVARDDVAVRALKVVLESAARRVLQLWAPLLGWVMLARGDIDGFVGYQPETVDLPAGVLLAVEAGMVIRRLDGTDFDDRMDLPPPSRSFVAARSDSIDRLTDLVRSAQRIEQAVSEMDLPGALR